jgi:glycerophosphodiester phosphodiesterase
MKFGRNLPQFTVPEWSASYIKYKALKKLIKSAAEKVKAGQEADLTGKCHTLALSLSNVPGGNHSLEHLSNQDLPVSLFP